MALSKHIVDIIKGTIQADQHAKLNDWLKLHAPERYDDVNGNGDDVFAAANMQQTDLRLHGYDEPQSKAVYTAVNPSTKATDAVKQMWQDSSMPKKGML